ncbi:LCP family protein [Symbioplanes lichenis]|uniref:LCP family protein n=1 Tax=Symbioplanes lichenis TaxID=1629072 RepID=UPI0027392A72|nr:LCP family protein [Actinoplanes lichenis]
MAVDVKTAPDPAPPRKKRRRRLVVVIVAVVLVVLAGGGALAATLYARDIDNDIQRVQAFDQVPEAERPVKEQAAGDAMNFLVLGSDTRDPESTGGSRSDTIILMHLPADRSGAQLVSIPRDTWTHIPKSADGQHGNTNAKINAAYAWGGTPLMVRTVENYTGVRIDHVVMVDFAGFKDIVDALGGVDIDVETAFTSTHSLNKDSVREFEAGPQTMDGATALDYARERYAFKDGDFARIRHQQQVIKAILNKAASGGTLTNPAKLNSFLRATADAVSVDETLNIFGMAGDLRHLRSDSLTFYTSPTTGTGTRGDQSVVLPDKPKAEQFFAAVKRDDVAEIKATGTVK